MFVLSSQIFNSKAQGFKIIMCESVAFQKYLHLSFKAY